METLQEYTLYCQFFNIQELGSLFENVKASRDKEFVCVVLLLYLAHLVILSMT